MTVYEKLLKVQAELRAPKGQRNSFGNYNYRSAEDIIEAVKPLLLDNELVLNINDDIIAIGNEERFYVKATVRVYDTKNPKDFVESVAFARESTDKKGMDSSQITGTASSYARKYAMNGMFAIDDTKDADTDAYTATVRKEKITTPNRAGLKSGGNSYNRNAFIDELEALPKSEIDAILEEYRKETGIKIDKVLYIKGPYMRQLWEKRNK